MSEVKNEKKPLVNVFIHKIQVVFIGAKKLTLSLPFMFVSATALELQDFINPVVDEFIRKFDTSHSIPLMPLRGGMSSSQVYKFDINPNFG